MNDRSLQSKIVILGLSQSGKTSIRQVVFEGFAPQATSLNPATVRINRKLFNFAGSSINLVDVGGQSSYLNELFEKYTERTFSDLKALIYVVDISDASNIMRSKYYFDLTLDNLKKLVLALESMFSPIKWMLFLLTKGLLLHVQLKIFLS